MKFEFMTVEEAAQILGVSEKSVRDFINSGELPATKIGQWKITTEGLKQFIESRSNRSVQSFLNNSGPQESGTLLICTICDYYTDNPMGLTEKLMTYVNSLPEDVPKQWNFTWDQATKRARYTAWGTPAFLSGMLHIIENYSDEYKIEVRRPTEE